MKPCRRLISGLCIGVAVWAATGAAAAQDGKFFPINRAHDSKFLPAALPSASGNRSEKRFFTIDRRAVRPRVIDRDAVADESGKAGEAPPPIIHRPRTASHLPLINQSNAEIESAAIRRPARPTTPLVPSITPFPGPTEPESLGGFHGWPIAPEAKSRVSSHYGWRIHPMTGERAFHTGVDIAAPSGTPVLATAPGIVHAIGQHPRLGNYVMIDYLDGSVGTYGHLKRIEAASGDIVARGDMVGRVGSTGRSTGPHLDYSLKIDGRNVDPLPLLSAPTSVASR
ncbi:MAG: hypothetical protein CMM50_12280 [Rhodospirillaceae bacterium]|nr:hypothetical protein [Rhodospirillaceae bacterium]